MQDIFKTDASAPETVAPAAPPAANGAAPGDSANPFAPGPGGTTPFSHPAPGGPAKTMASILGEIVWLMSQSPTHKTYFISDLEWLVMTPVYLQQFRLFYDTQKPIGVVFWGLVDAEVEERLSVGTSKMRPQDWKCGDKLWVTEVLAPFGGHEAMVADLKEKVFPTREIKMLVTGADGTRTVRAV